MPEALEVELSRLAALGLIGRRMEVVERTDPLVVGDGVDVEVPGALIEGVERRGKQLVLVTDGPRVGVHFGMTGRLLRDGEAAIDQLAYSPSGDGDVWDRWVVALDDGSRLRFHDPRRFGRIRLDPDVERLGPDVLALTRADLAAALAGRRAPVKAVLLDQRAVAGLGNLLVDEVLWWSSIDPRRPSGSLDDDEIRVLQRTIRRRLPAMLRRGGSHTGTLSPQRRVRGLRCARDGTELCRGVVGGRSTFWCPSHQR